MEENDFQHIEEMMSRMIGQYRGEIGHEMGRFKGESAEGFRQQWGTQREDFQHNLDLVVEGQQMLVEKQEETRSELNAEIAKVDQRGTAVAADLSAHRRDTEAHRKG